MEQSLYHPCIDTYRRCRDIQAALTLVRASRRSSCASSARRGPTTSWFSTSIAARGRLGVMNYYQMKNVVADTDMRNSFSGASLFFLGGGG